MQEASRENRQERGLAAERRQRVASMETSQKSSRGYKPKDIKAGGLELQGTAKSRSSQAALSTVCNGHAKAKSSSREPSLPWPQGTNAAIGPNPSGPRSRGDT
jgi:hypothetical protein